MRTVWLAVILVLGCDAGSPTALGGPGGQSEPADGNSTVPIIHAVIVENTSAFQRLRLVGDLNGNAGPLYYRYRVFILGADGSVTDELPWTAWATGTLPTVQIYRHPHRPKVLIWDARDGVAGEYSTGLRIVDP